MKRELLYSKAFSKATKKLVKRNIELAIDIRTTLTLLEKDAFDKKLKTHKLSGILKSSYACSVNYELRIVFSFIKEYEKEFILLESIGTHDEVY